MTGESPKTSTQSGRSVVACDGDAKSFVLEMQRRFMKRHGAQISQEKIMAKLIAKADLKLADLNEFAPVIADTKAA